MRRDRTSAVGVALVAAVLAFGTAPPPADASGGAAPTAAARAPAQEVVVVGTNTCLGCTLKTESGAHAQCSVYGHRHGLRVESAADPQGRALPGLAGEALHYLDNDASAALVKGEATHGQRVRIQGILYPADHVIEVRTVTAP